VGFSPGRLDGGLTIRSALMYSHREPQSRVDVMDLDPYGTAAPFIDGAVQSVRDGGESFSQLRTQGL